MLELQKLLYDGHWAQGSCGRAFLKQLYYYYIGTHVYSLLTLTPLIKQLVNARNQDAQQGNGEENEDAGAAMKEVIDA